MLFVYHDHKKFMCITDLIEPKSDKKDTLEINDLESWLLNLQNRFSLIWTLVWYQALINCDQFVVSCHFPPFFREINHLFGRRVVCYFVFSFFYLGIVYVVWIHWSVYEELGIFGHFTISFSDHKINKAISKPP